MQKGKNEEDLVQVTLPTGNLIFHVKDSFFESENSKPRIKKDIVFSRIKLPKGFTKCCSHHRTFSW